eukprot:TRINITY_DN322_c2_g2_i1.p2 TRINITY_DN322_c2_g2~~TRINITY_DN322_c2_g2_i1.p2  ORF type:complete len:117 (+),score=15.11 TRINITY_DN322_c2_g2_i1:249-599(+)
MTTALLATTAAAVVEQSLATKMETENQRSPLRTISAIAPSMCELASSSHQHVFHFRVFRRPNKRSVSAWIVATKVQNCAPGVVCDDDDPFGRFFSSTVTIAATSRDTRPVRSRCCH